MSNEGLPRLFWRRLVRVTRQSRIRLPQSAPSPEQLIPGHWIQIGSTSWRVGKRKRLGQGTVIELSSTHSSERARLSVDGAGEGLGIRT